ncbi:MAG: DUF4446 family protein [Candidatus Sungbacteria bacterium]|nr:DUF4446 family protein [Candidatus Sungbacteria bacterium]
MTTDPIIIAIAVLGALAIAMSYFLYDTRKKFQWLFKSDLPENYGPALAQALERIDLAEKEIKVLSSRADILESIARISFQKIGFMRFNPFENTGGDQSFALCLLDKDNNGVIISSLYGREGTRVYAKAVDHGIPKHPISNEEKEVLERATRKNF